MFTKSQHLVKFLPIMKVSFQRIKKDNFHTHYFIWVLAYVFILRHFIWKWIIWGAYSRKTIIPDSCIKSFLNSLYKSRVVIIQNVPKKYEVASLGRNSFQISKKLQKSFTNKLTSFNLTISFTSPGRVINFFTFKDNVPKILLLGLFYNCKWDGCNATYYGKTSRLFKVRIYDHFNISHLNGKNVKTDKNKLTAIQKHLLCCKYCPSFKKF